MVKIKCIDNHSPPMEIEVSDKDANKYLATGKWKIKGEKKAEKSFKEELIALNRIGKETAEDIIKVFPSKELLIKAINAGEYLPFRNDIAKILKEEI